MTPKTGALYAHCDPASTAALVDERIDTKRAGLVIYALQVASHNLSRVNFEPGRRKVVIEPSFELKCLKRPPPSATPEPTQDAPALSPQTGTDS